MGNKVDGMKNSDLLKIMVNLEETDEAEQDTSGSILEDARVTRITLQRITVLDKGITALGFICIALGIIEVRKYLTLVSS